MKEQGKKTRGSIDKKLPKFNEETRRKINYLYVTRVKNF